jgi:long-chain acyl-CoA synthetase
MSSIAQPATPPAVPEARPWLRWYEPGVPADIEVPDWVLPRLLAASAARYPARPAIRFLGGTLTYRALDEAAGRFAGALRGLGVREGDRVALLLPNCPQFVIAFYGALRAGAVVAPPSPLDAAAELRQGWGDAGVRAAVCLATFYPEVAAVRPDLPTLERVVVTGITDDAPALSRLLFPLTREGRAARPPAIPEDAHTHRFRALLASATPDRAAPARAATAVGAR